MQKTLMLVTLMALVGCSSAPTNNSPQNPSPDAVFSQPPHLWSGQKVLDEAPEACANKSVEILQALQFIGVVKNGSYVYGTLFTNRAAVKCIAIGEKTFVYAAVAGPDVKQVERLRNEIVWRL